MTSVVSIAERGFSDSRYRKLISLEITSLFSIRCSVLQTREEIDAT
jgi:hypothetical protein